MRWFRGRKRYGAYAALFALLIQFALSFGHLHVGYSAQTTATTAALAPEAGDNGPLDRGTRGPVGHVCDLCATINLLASAQLATPPALLVPLAFDTDATAYPAQTAPAEPLRVNFRSRAPPLA
jgi:hypothetical protein